MAILKQFAVIRGRLYRGLTFNVCLDSAMSLNHDGMALRQAIIARKT
jgi:hypothetical protein